MRCGDDEWLEFLGSDDDDAPTPTSSGSGGSGDEAGGGVSQHRDRPTYHVNSLGFLRGELERHGWKPAAPGARATFAQWEQPAVYRPPGAGPAETTGAGAVTGAAVGRRATIEMYPRQVLETLNNKVALGRYLRALGHGAPTGLVDENEGAGTKKGRPESIVPVTYLSATEMALDLETRSFGAWGGVGVGCSGHGRQYPRSEPTAAATGLSPGGMAASRMGSVPHDAEPLLFLKASMMEAALGVRVFGSGTAVAEAVRNDAIEEGDYVIQLEVPRLALLDGRKFSTRAYLVIWGSELWLGTEYLVKVHAEPYSRQTLTKAAHVESRGANAGITAVAGSSLPQHRYGSRIVLGNVVRAREPSTLARSVLGNVVRAQEPSTLARSVVRRS